MAPGLVPSPRRDDILLSPNAPGGGGSSIRLASSSTTHSVTGPVPRASMTENPAESLLPYLQFLQALWRPNPCLSFYFSICLYSMMPAPVPNGTLWFQTSPILGVPLLERCPLVPGVWCGRGVSATRFPTHTLPQNGNFDEIDEKNEDKTKYCCPDPRASRLWGQSLLSSKHPLL